MLKGLQAWPVGDDLAQMKARGCELVRVDIQRKNGGDQDWPARVIDAGLEPLAIIDHPEQIAEQATRGCTTFECGNEPDLIAEGWQESPAVYWRRFGAAIAYAADYGVQVYLGAVSNLKKESLRFLRGLPWDAIPPTIGCSHHWYPDDDRPHASHISHLTLKYPFQVRNTRDQDIAELKGIVGDRPLALSETGWWDGPFRTQQTVAEWYVFERAFWQRHGYVFSVGYQLNDAPPGEPWDPAMGYGFRALTGEWKPSAAAWLGETA